MFEAIEPSLFWRIATYLVLGASVLLIVSAAIWLAVAFVKGAHDDGDVA